MDWNFKQIFTKYGKKCVCECAPFHLILSTSETKQQLEESPQLKPENLRYS
jgi:hypothetical protein